MRIHVENLDRINTEDLIKEYFNELDEVNQAVDVAGIIDELHERSFTIARSTLHNVLLVLMSEGLISRKKIGIKYFYYKVNK